MSPRRAIPVTAHESAHAHDSCHTQAAFVEELRHISAAKPGRPAAEDPRNKRIAPDVARPSHEIYRVLVLSSRVFTEPNSILQRVASSPHRLVARDPHDFLIDIAALIPIHLIVLVSIRLALGAGLDSQWGRQSHDRLARSRFYTTGNDYPMSAAISPDMPETRVSQFATISAFFSELDVHQTESSLTSVLP